MENDDWDGFGEYPDIDVEFLSDLFQTFSKSWTLIQPLKIYLDGEKRALSTINKELGGKDYRNMSFFDGMVILQKFITLKMVNYFILKKNTALLLPKFLSFDPTFSVFFIFFENAIKHYEYNKLRDILKLMVIVNWILLVYFYADHKRKKLTLDYFIKLTQENVNVIIYSLSAIEREVVERKMPVGIRLLLGSGFKKGEVNIMSNILLNSINTSIETLAELELKEELERKRLEEEFKKKVYGKISNGLQTLNKGLQIFNKWLDKINSKDENK